MEAFKNPSNGKIRQSRRSEEGEVAVLTGQVRIVRLEGVRGAARCLLVHLCGLGAGAAAAARRQAWAEAEEQSLRLRQAHILSLGQGQHPMRREANFSSA